MASVITGWTIPDSFALFFVYFLIGHFARDVIFRFAQWVITNPLPTVTALAIWAALELLGVAADSHVQGLKPEHSPYLEFHRQRVFRGTGACL